jgi:hydroxylamine oxidation protein HaoB
MALAQAAAPIAKRWRSAAGGALVAGGLVLIGWSGWSLLQPDAAPYGYQLVAEGGVERFPELGLERREDLTVRKFELRAEGIEGAAALAHVASRAGAAPVALAWKNQTAEPALAFDTRPADVVALAKAVAKHAPAGAPVLAWWDSSRQLKLLAGSVVLYDENLARPLLLPEGWRRARAAIEALEREFWQAPVQGEADRRFERFVDALVMETPAAVAALRQLAGAGDAYVVVRLADAYRAGMLRPERLGIGYRDFPRSIGPHSGIMSVKAWMKREGYESYAVEEQDEKTMRVYFLTDAASRGALIARMLPFSSSNPFTLEAPQLVHREGPYWVYMLPPSQR